MNGPRTIPPMTERAFLRRYMTIWNITGVSAVLAGLIVGPRILHRSHNPWLSIVLAFALYAISALLCPLVLMRVWRKPEVSPAVLFFSIPIGVAGLALIFFMRSAGPSYLYVQKRELHGLYLATGFLYAASLIWAIAVGMHRKQMGSFEIGDSQP